MARTRESVDAAPATHVANGNTHSAEPAPTLCAHCKRVIDAMDSRFGSIEYPEDLFCSKRCRLTFEVDHAIG